MSKESVRLYVDGLCAKRRGALEKAITEIYDDTLKPLVKARIKELTGRVDEWADYIYRQLSTNRDDIEQLGACKEHQTDTRLSNAMAFSNIQSSYLSNCWHDFVKYVENPSNGVFDFGSEPVNDMVTFLQKDITIQSLIKDRKAIDTLRVELSKNCGLPGSGKQAYNRMVALGIDMSGYEEPMANLPAVQKLSVDVCVLSGNC